jgi:preprotein translocase subunit YajC
MNSNNNTATQATTATPATTGICPPSAGHTGLLGSLTPMLLILAAFYFLLMRPQQKKDAKRREMINAVKRDDKVLTTAGIICKVHKILNEKEVVLEVAEGVRMRFLKSAISEILEKGAEIGADEAKAGASAVVESSKNDDKKSAKNATKNKTVAKKK